jgi:hypothetical protein
MKFSWNKLCWAACAVGVGLAIFNHWPWPDPTMDVLESGTQAVAACGSGHAWLRNDNWEQGFELIPTGTRVMVGYDPGCLWDTEEYREKYLKYDIKRSKVPEGAVFGMGVKWFRPPGKRYPPDKDAGLREIQVVVETGPYQGLSGTIMRMELKPVK